MARYFTVDYALDRDDVRLKPLVKGRKVIAGTILGRVGSFEKDDDPYVRFEVRPAGKGAPRIDPKPILDGWKLLESTAVYRAPDSGPLAQAASNEDPDRRPAPAHEQGGAAEARAERRAHQDLLVRPA